jgi:putative hemolysin
MELPTSLGLVAVVVLVLANGFFVATEFAIVAVRRSRLDQLVQEGHPTAKAARDVVGHLDSYIAATQFGITLSSLALGWLGEPALAHLIEPPLIALVGGFAPAAAHGVAIAIAFAIITGLHIVVGELAPKGLALQRPEATTLWVARPIMLFYALFRWPVGVLNAVGNGALRLAGLEPASGHEMVHSVEELRLLVTGMQEAGVVDANEARIAARAFNFADLTADALMVPRTELTAVADTATLDEVLALAKSGTLSRLLVYEGTLDHVVGVIYMRDLLTVLDRPREGFDLRAIVRPTLLMPATKAADELLEEMRVARRHTAVVIDEYGGTAGVVTLSNLMAGLVGRIEEEPPIGTSAPLLGPASNPDGSRLIDGLMRIDELEELVGVAVDEAIKDEVDTVGGLVMTQLGRVPEIGDEVDLGGWRLRVEERDGFRVAVVRLSPTVADSAAA